MAMSDEGRVDEGSEGNGPGADEHDLPFEAEQLALDEDGERLPWLEGEDDFDDEEDSGTGRVIALMLFGLLLLGAIVGGIWWATHRSPDETLVADGSTIPAPEGPYKEAPRDPGGKTFAGTGDTTFAVSEGQTRPARLGEQGGDVRPGVDVTSKPATLSPAPAARPSASPAPAADTSGVGVQVGAFSTRASAEAAWSRLAQRHSEALSGVRHRIIEGRADIGTVFRLQAVAGDVASARALCSRLKSAGQDCAVKN